MRIGQKISWLLVGTALVATGLLTSIGYSVARGQYFAGVDHQLTAAVESLPHVLGEAYLHRVLSGDPLPTEEYDRVVLKLSDLADRAGVFYLYAFILKDGKVIHIATSASEKERQTKDWGFLREYEEPPPELIATFSDGQTRFAEYTDEYGSFRSIFVRRTGPGGREYVVGVDVELSRIHADLRGLVWRYLAAGGAVTGIAGILGIILARRISQPLQAVTQEIDHWSRRDFAPDDAIQDRLKQLASKQRDEAGELAARFVDVQKRLQVYLRELTAETAAREKIEQQIEVARTIQEDLLPRQMPKIENFQITGWSQPADKTGGDFFDVLELPDGSFAATIGDVTGHGIGPALLASASRAYARATFNQTDALDAMIAKVNNLLMTDMQEGRFVTLVACLLNPKARQMKLVAAGHGPIMFFSRRKNEMGALLDTHGLPLGVTDQFGYDRPMHIQFEAGDALVLVSDGFFEWSNAAGETFGIERLTQSVLASCREAPEQIIERLRRDVANFHGGTSQADDTTALVIRCVG